MAATKLREGGRIDVIADQTVLEIGAPIDVDRAGDVAGIVEEDVLVRLDDAEVGIIYVFCEPGSFHERLGMGIGSGAAHELTFRPLQKRRKKFPK